MSDEECLDDVLNNYSKAGCCSSLALVHSLFTDAAAAVPDPAFIVSYMLICECMLK